MKPINSFFPRRLGALAPAASACLGLACLAAALLLAPANAWAQAKFAISAYKVQGTVALSTSADGKQAVQIDWVVVDPAGNRVGKASQKNSIPQGSLDGAWGQTADLVASAAAQGIIKLLPAKAVN